MRCCRAHSVANSRRVWLCEGRWVLWAWRRCTTKRHSIEVLVYKSLPVDFLWILADRCSTRCTDRREPDDRLHHRHGGRGEDRGGLCLSWWRLSSPLEFEELLVLRSDELQLVLLALLLFFGGLDSTHLFLGELVSVLPLLDEGDVLGVHAFQLLLVLLLYSPLFLSDVVLRGLQLVEVVLELPHLHCVKTRPWGDRSRRSDHGVSPPVCPFEASATDAVEIVKLATEFLDLVLQHVNHLVLPCLLRHLQFERLLLCPLLHHTPHTRCWVLRVGRRGAGFHRWSERSGWWRGRCADLDPVNRLRGVAGGREGRRQGHSSRHAHGVCWVVGHLIGGLAVARVGGLGGRGGQVRAWNGLSGREGGEGLVVQGGG
eukprot:Sspe_Gene.56236::Locus_30943_Transcript_1_1_Confidence_1.000_Length_1555::g.56236::m.56236